MLSISIEKQRKRTPFLAFCLAKEMLEQQRLPSDIHMLRLDIYRLSPLPPISTTIGDLDLLHVMKPWYCWKYPTHLQFILTDHVSTVMLNVFQVFARKWQHARRLTPQCLQNAHS
jgi:hypothetical protein